MADEFDGWIRGEALREGGQAWTYLAYRKGDDARKRFVLKVLKHKSKPARLKRFEREIEIGARLRHANVVAIETENVRGNKPYVVMEYCPGGELRDLDISQLSMLDKLRMFKGICEGVAHIHSKADDRKYLNATVLLPAVNEAIERIMTMAHAIDANILQSCAYCGVGTYQTILHDNAQSAGFEMKAYALGIKINNVAGFTGHKWLIMACDYCGNLQWFRTDLATKNPNAWEKGSRP